MAVINYKAVRRSLKSLRSQVGSAMVGFIQSGTGAVKRIVQDKLRETVSVKDFGAVGDGVTDDTAAIQAGIDSDCGTLFFPTGIYRTTSVLTMTGTCPSLRGAGNRYNNASTSRILIDHSGIGINVVNQVGIAVNIENLVIARDSDYAGQGVNVAFDGNVGSTVVSHSGMRNVHIEGGATALYLRALIFGDFEDITINGATKAVYFPGAGHSFPNCNVINFRQLSIAAATDAILFEGDAGRNIFFHNTNIESSTDTIEVASGATVQNVVFDGLWLEGNTNPIKLAAGDHIFIKNVRNADGADHPLLDDATFAAKNVEVSGQWGASVSNTIGTADVSADHVEGINTYGGEYSFTASDKTRSFAQGLQIVPTLSAQKASAASLLDVCRQSGRISKNYLLNWNIPGSGAWDMSLATNVATATDPLGGSTAYTWTGYGYGSCAGTGMPAVAVGQEKEMVVWAKGTGVIKLQNWSVMHQFFVNTTVWQRLSFRTVIEDVAQAMDGMNITITPETTGSLAVWRPGVYEGFDSIDCRPSAISGSYEGGYIDLSTYVSGAREHLNMVVYGTAAPASGDWMVGDKVINTAPSAGGNAGWVCTTAGTPGTWKTFGAIAA